MANWGAGNYMITMAAARKRAEEADKMRKWQSRENEKQAWRNFGLGLLGTATGGLIQAGTGTLGTYLQGLTPEGQSKMSSRQAQADYTKALTDRTKTLTPLEAKRVEAQLKELEGFRPGGGQGAAPAWHPPMAPPAPSAFSQQQPIQPNPAAATHPNRYQTSTPSPEAIRQGYSDVGGAYLDKQRWLYEQLKQGN